MRAGPVAFLVLVCTAVTLAAIWAFELSFERVLLLAPVLVVGGAAIAGLALVWARAFVDSVRGGGRPLD
jgi:hypothetical protein